jgi:hypothetical protein
MACVVGSAVVRTRITRFWLAGQSRRWLGSVPLAHPLDEELTGSLDRISSGGMSRNMSRQTWGSGNGDRDYQVHQLIHRVVLTKGISMPSAVAGIHSSRLWGPAAPAGEE